MFSLNETIRQIQYNILNVFNLYANIHETIIVWLYVIIFNQLLRMPRYNTEVA